MKWSISARSIHWTPTTLASVARTGRLLCVGESFPWGGATAEIIARVTAEVFSLLDAAPQRLNAKDTIRIIPISGRRIVPMQKRSCESSRLASTIKFMPQVRIIMPQLGESIAEATIVDIKVKAGDDVVDDQEIIDVDEQSRHGRDHAMQRQHR